ncbi:hypothetical protein JCM10296v2_004385 [Rhodotorula toruloides]
MGQSQSTQSRSAKAEPRLKGESRGTADASTTAAEPASASPRNRRQIISRRFQLKGRQRRRCTEAQRSLREAMEQQRQAETMLADLKRERERRPSAPRLALGSNGGLEGLRIVFGDGSISRCRQASPESSEGESTNGNSQTAAGRAPADAALDSSRLLALPDASTMPRSFGDRSSTPGLSTSSSTVPSSPCPDQPTPKSHWSESSVGIPTPQLPFQSFRDSLNLNRLSQLFPSGTSFGATPASPRSLDLERFSDAFTSDDKVVALRGEQTKRRKTGAGRPQIVVVDAQPIGAKRYSQVVAAEGAAQMELERTARKGSTGGASIATIRPNPPRKASVVSTAGSVDVWDSDIPWPATPSPICRDLPALPTATWGIDFSGYTLGKPAARPVSCISTGSDLPPELVDALPAPPLPPLPPFARPRVPAKLDLSRQARDSILTATASSPRILPSHASTPSTSSFASSLTSQASLEVGPKSGGPVVSVHFGAAALAGKTYRPPSSAGSVATFVLEDIIDELNGLHFEEKKAGLPGRCERLLSLEQPDPHLAEHLVPTVFASTIVPQGRSPPLFQSVFSLDKRPSTSKPLPALVSPLSHALLDDSRFDSPRLPPLTPDSAHLTTGKLHDLPPSVPASLEPSPVPPQKPWPSRPRIASADAAHRSPSQQAKARRDTYPTFVPPSQRAQQPNLFDALLEQASPADEQGDKSGGASRERRLGSKAKRGFDKADIGAWLDRARRESEEHAPMRPVVRV